MVASQQREDFAFETNLGELADRFAALVASPELSADLALQIVLNEIAEQACKATGATGAAVALQRDHELVCRASSGSTAPELGAPLNTKQSLSGECVRTGQIQICGDIENDSRADAMASRKLGARSVIVLPLMSGVDVVGVLEAFAMRPSAFGDEEKRKLEALAQKVLHNVDLAARWSPKAPTARTGFEKQSVGVPAETMAQTLCEAGSSEILSDDADSTARRSGAGVVITRVASLAVLLVAIGLWARVFERLGWFGMKAGSPVGVVAQARNGTAPARVGDQASSAANAPSAAKDSVLKSPIDFATIKKAAGADSLPPGSLVVYENGREVFRVPGGQESHTAARATAQGAIQQAVSIEPETTSPDSGMRGLRVATGTNLLRQVAPEYPQEAQQQKIQGVVVLDVKAGGDGFVKQVNIVSGDPRLAAASVAAVNQWQFRPQRVNGQATEIQTRVTLNFKLPE